jgi:hypothetical protein
VLHQPPSRLFVNFAPISGPARPHPRPAVVGFICQDVQPFHRAATRKPPHLGERSFWPRRGSRPRGSRKSGREISGIVLLTNVDSSPLAHLPIATKPELRGHRNRARTAGWSTDQSDNKSLVARQTVPLEGVKFTASRGLFLRDRQNHITNSFKVKRVFANFFWAMNVCNSVTTIIRVNRCSDILVRLSKGRDVSLAVGIGNTL